MKLTCVKDSLDKTKFFTREGYKEKIVGLTAGKVYSGTLVPIVFSILDGTRIDEDDMRFMIYNDDGKWEAYSKTFFAPFDEVEIV